MGLNVTETKELIAKLCGIFNLVEGRTVFKSIYGVFIIQPAELQLFVTYSLHVTRIKLIRGIYRLQ